MLGTRIESLDDAAGPPRSWRNGGHDGWWSRAVTWWRTLVRAMSWSRARRARSPSCACRASIPAMTTAPAAASAPPRLPGWPGHGSARSPAGRQAVRARGPGGVGRLDAGRRPHRLGSSAPGRSGAAGGGTHKTPRPSSSTAEHRQPAVPAIGVRIHASPGGQSARWSQWRHARRGWHRRGSTQAPAETTRCATTVMTRSVPSASRSSSTVDRPRSPVSLVVVSTESGATPMARAAAAASNGTVAEGMSRRRSSPGGPPANPPAPRSPARAGRRAARHRHRRGLARPPRA